MTMTVKQQIANVERERAFLEEKLQNLIKQILDEMEFEKLIRKEKSGNSYVIKLG